jgi:hypothetical protein
MILKKTLPPLAHGQRGGGLGTETPGGGVQTQRWGKKIDHQYQVVASKFTPSMGKKPLMSWTWAQLSNNQRTSIAILIKGK